MPKVTPEYQIISEFKDLWRKKIPKNIRKLVRENAIKSHNILSIHIRINDLDRRDNVRKEGQLRIYKKLYETHSRGGIKRKHALERNTKDHEYKKWQITEDSIQSI